MSSAVLEELLGPSLEQKKPSPRTNLTFGEIGYGYRPGRSFGFSVIVHQLGLILIILFTRFAFVHTTRIVPPRLEPVAVDNVIYLPNIGGGSEGSGTRGGGAGNAEDLSSGFQARSRRGFAYPGQRPSVSDPPRATLGIQTILQPSLQNPPLLRRDLPLPEIAYAPPVAAPEQPEPVVKVESGRKPVSVPSEPVQAPKLNLPRATSSDLLNLAEADTVMPQAPPPKPIPAPAELSDAGKDVRKQQGLLVLNAIPPPQDVTADIPLAEERSRFAVAPGEATVIADPASGAKGGGSSSMAAGTGTQSDIASGDALADAATGGGNNKDVGASGSGNGGHYGSAMGTGLNPAGEASGVGHGVASGAGTGGAEGTTLGSGTGAGSAPGHGTFPGITVRGGRYGSGNRDGDSEALHASVTTHRQTSYQMTITSTASSGGGLPDLGLFQNEKVYTVYLDMRANDEDTAPSWILQYALQQPTNKDTANGIHGTPTPPYATLKEIPRLTSELAAKCARKMIIVSAMMGVNGKLEQIEVRQTPDLQINTPLVDALANWTFQPAQLDGKPVPLKTLLGIRLAAR